jgi:hypothetical protein
LEPSIVRYLRLISYTLTIAGILAVVLSLTLDLPSMWTLTGMLLVVAGVVKIAMVALWHGVASVHTPPIPREDA